MARSFWPPPINQKHPLCPAFHEWLFQALPLWPLTRLIDFLLVDVRLAALALQEFIWL